MNKKVLTVLAVLMAILAAGFLFLDSESDNNADTNSSGEELGTASLSKYENTEYGFSFSYPQDWKIVDTGDSGPLISVAPKSYNFKDGTEAPYGSFLVWPFGFNVGEELRQERLAQPLDSGWLVGEYGTSRNVISEDERFKIVMIPFGEEGKEVLEEILLSFEY